MGKHHGGAANLIDGLFARWIGLRNAAQASRHLVINPASGPLQPDLEWMAATRPKHSAIRVAVASPHTLRYAQVVEPLQVQPGDVFEDVDQNRRRFFPAAVISAVGPVGVTAADHPGADAG